MPLIAFPNVPALPGVPQLARALGGLIPSAPAMLTADDPLVAGLVAAPSWGVFDPSGAPVAVSDAFVEFEFVKEWRVSDYPQEPGAFTSYNKVELPYDAVVALAKGRSEADRGAFIQAIDSAVASLTLYTVAMPEKTYANANLVGYRFQRKATQGATLIIAEIKLRQIRVTGTTDFKNTASPAGASQQNNGTVQAQTPSAAEAGAAAAGAT